MEGGREGERDRARAQVRVLRDSEWREGGRERQSKSTGEGVERQTMEGERTGGRDRARAQVRVLRDRQWRERGREEETEQEHR